MNAAPQLDAIRAIAHYIKTMLKPKEKEKEISGMKTLLLDKETKTIVSMVFSMNEILSKQVFLIEALDAPHEGKMHMKAIVLVRPTMENIKSLIAHAASPKFLEYHLFFTNVCPEDNLRKLADADKSGVVKQVQEYYADYYALNSDTFSLNVSGSLSLCRNPSPASNPHAAMSLKRTQQGILSALLSFKVRPHIRYLGASETARKLASDLKGQISSEAELFTFNKGGANTLLLIMDRSEDPLTPLLLPWTYQAMVDELLPGGLKNNTVDLKGQAGVSKEMEEIVLSPASDEFYRKNMYSNYGDLAEAMGTFMEDYKKAQGIHHNISSIEDMARFVDMYPELKSKGFSVGKHATLLGLIAKTIEGPRRLFDLSEIEQSIAVNDDAEGQATKIAEYLSGGPKGSIDSTDALRLLMMYALRYERTKPAKVAEVKKLIAHHVPSEVMELLNTLLKFGGAGVRTLDLFGTGGGGGAGGWLTSLKRAAKASLAFGEEAKNVLTLHNPLLVSILRDVARGALQPTKFPYATQDPGAGTKYTNVIIFMIGGITMGEAAKVAAINAGELPLVEGAGGGSSSSFSNSSSSGGSSAGASGLAPPPFRVILGGTSMINSSSYIAELLRMQTSVSIDMEGSSSNSSSSGVFM